MRGKVLGFNKNTGEGVISGADNKRYSFSASNICSEPIFITPGRDVDFEVDGGKAIGIFSLEAGTDAKSKFIAAALAFFLGSWGIHKFYLGKITAGIIMAIISSAGIFLLGIPTFIIVVISIMESVIYLTMNDQKFYDTYVIGSKEWF
jgi:TM2 domain-containing membrane protein YozV